MTRICRVRVRDTPVHFVHRLEHLASRFELTNSLVAGAQQIDWTRKNSAHHMLSACATARGRGLAAVVRVGQCQAATRQNPAARSSGCLTSSPVRVDA